MVQIMANGPSEHEQQTKQGLAFFWVLALAGGLVVVFALTQWGLLDDVPVSEVGWLAVGTGNGIGLIAIGGWNAIGLIAIGGGNSIGLIAIGGFNAVGGVTFSGLNSMGLITFGGLNSVGAVFSVRFYNFSPVVLRRGSA